MTDKITSTAYYDELKDSPAFHFILINELPEDQKEPFKLWLRGEAQPVIYQDISIECAYSWDYSIWYDYYLLGEIAPKN